MQMPGNKNTLKIVIRPVFWLGIFIFLFVFFTTVHPLQVWDGDDWLYIAWRRNAYPMWGAWNPSRVLPETLMSLVGDFCVYVLYPLMGDYLKAMTAGNALVICLSILVYLGLFYRLMKKKLQAGDGAAYMLTAFFLLFHFMIFRRAHEYNTHLFYASNLTGHYFYVFANVLNASLVLYFMGNEDGRFMPEGYIKKGILILALYLAIYSNLFQTITLMAYMGVRVLKNLISVLIGPGSGKEKKAGEVWIGFLKDSAVPLLAIFFWLISMVFELSGGRASSNSGNIPLSESLGLFMGWFGRFNQQLGALTAGVLVLAPVLMILKKTDRRLSAEGFGNLFCMAVCGVFAVLLCSVTGSEHMGRSSVVFPVFFYLLVAVLWEGAVILKQYPAGLTLLPLVFYVMLVNTGNGTRVFRETNWHEFPSATCYALQQDYLDQLLVADAAGETDTVLYVPVFEYEEDGDNWPHAFGMGNAMADTLYSQGILSRKMDVSVEPVRWMNEKYHLE